MRPTFNCDQFLPSSVLLNAIAYDVAYSVFGSCDGSRETISFSYKPLQFHVLPLSTVLKIPAPFTPAYTVPELRGSIATAVILVPLIPEFAVAHVVPPSMLLKIPKPPTPA